MYLDGISLLATNTGLVIDWKMWQTDQLETVPVPQARIIPKRTENKKAKKKSNNTK
jgi:hypothetical protein